MNRGLYVVASDDCVCSVWERIIRTLSIYGTDWVVDCLDCLYETKLKSGFHSTDMLLSEVEDNTYIFSARMIGIPIGQALDRVIISSDDYVASNCHSIILCADGVHFEVFSKYHDLLLQLSNSFTDNEVKSKVWIDDTMCGRSEFTV